MRIMKMLSLAIYLISWTVCIIPVTPAAQHPAWDGTEIKIEKELRNKNQELAIIEQDEKDLDEEELPESEKSYENHCGCEHPRHDSQNFPGCMKDETDPSAYDSGDRSYEELEMLDQDSR